MRITYLENHAVTCDKLIALYRSVEWINYTQNPDMLEAAYQHSLYTITAWEEGQLIGIVRIVGDGNSIIYIQDLIVHPDYQRRGIGTCLMKRVLEKYQAVYQKVLLTDNETRTQEFYESLGFVDVRQINARSYFYYPEN